MIDPTLPRWAYMLLTQVVGYVVLIFLVWGALTRKTGEGKARWGRRPN